MTFVSDLAAGRAELQQHAESAMVDSVLIEREDGYALDPDTLEQVTAWVTVYAGRCKVRSASALPRDAAAGETVYDVTASYLDLPLSDPASGGVRAGDQATITATAFDPANVGRVLTVQQDIPRTYPIERRLFCQEVS